MRDPFNMEKFIKVNTLAHEIQELEKDIKLNEYIPDRIKNNLKINNDKIVFTGIDLEDYHAIKFIVDKQKGKDIVNLENIKIDLWVPAFPNEPVEQKQLKYDLVLSGSGLLLWPLGLLFDGRWIEEHLFFIDANFDDSYKDYDSWNNEKYIPKAMREKVSELIGLMGSAPFNIICSPQETHLMNSCGKSQKNLIDLRLKLFTGLKTGTLETFENIKTGNVSNFHEEVYHIYLALLISELGVAAVKTKLEIVNDKYCWSKEIESHLFRLCSLFGVSKHNIIYFMKELFCVETRNELYPDAQEKDKLITRIEKDIITSEN